MAIAFANSGAGVGGTTSIDVAYPASISAGDLLVISVVTKYPSNHPPTPSGWNLGANRTGGAGSAGVDSGTIDVRHFYKVADGTETGTVNLANASANMLVGRMTRFTKAANKSWNFATGFGSQNSATTSWSCATLLTDVTAGDMVFSSCGVNSNANSFSAEAITATGLTMGTEAERTEFLSAQGDDGSLVSSTHAVSSGTASGVVTYTMTCSGSSANEPAGAVVLLRLREVDPIEVPVATLATAAFAPTIAKATTSPTLALVTTKFAPTPVKIATPTTASLVTASFAPVMHKVVVVPTATLAATGLPPVAAKAVTPTTAAMTTTGLAPVARKIVTPPTASLVATGLAPTIAKTVVPPTAALVTTTFEPTVLIGAIIIPPTAALVLATFAPTVAKQVIVGTRALVLAGYAPTAGVPVAPSGGLSPVVYASVSFSKVVASSVESRRRIVGQVELD